MLRASRFKWLVLFLASATFAAGGVLVFFAAPGGRVGGVVVFAFFGACALIAAVQLVMGSTLALDPDGFTTRSFGRSVTRRWTDVESFVLISPSAFNQIVGINFPADHALPGVRKVTRGLLGYESALPDTYGMKARHLAALMNEWRARYVTLQR